jgi:signal transduction histidine kinase
MKYSPATDLVKIRLDSTGGKIRVAVQDFGIGIPKDQQEHIFDRFYRVESQAKHFSGLGMGLFISSEIIQRHQGRLWVESAPGNGSVFFFELPAAGTNSEQLKD